MVQYRRVDQSFFPTFGAMIITNPSIIVVCQAFKLILPEQKSA